MWKLWVVAKRDACLCKESQGVTLSINFPAAEAGFVLCQLQDDTLMHRVDFEWIWKGLKSQALSCRCQEIQEVRNVLETWCDAIGSYLSVLHQPPQHLYLERFKQETHNSSWDFVGDAKREEVKVDFEDEEDGDEMPRHLVARTQGLTVSDVLSKDLRQVLWKLNAMTCNYCNWMRLVQLSMIA